MFPDGSQLGNSTLSLIGSGSVCPTFGRCTMTREMDHGSEVEIKGGTKRYCDMLKRQTPGWTTSPQI